MSVRLNGSTSGYTELDAQASPGNNTLKFPASNGAARQAMRNGTTPGTMEFADDLVLMTAQNSISGNSIDFTGIPSWVKRITVMLENVSTNGTSALQIQIGAGSISASNYYSYSGAIDGTLVGTATSSTGLLIGTVTANFSHFGQAVLTKLNASNWAYSGAFGVFNASNPRVHISGGTTASAITGTLDRIRITTVNGTDTFDAGTINVMYE